MEPTYLAHNAAPVYGAYKIFPYWHIEKSVGSEESLTSIWESVDEEHRVIRWREDRQRIRIGGMTLTPEAHQELQNFRRLMGGMDKLFLMLDRREFEAENEFLGQSDGAKTLFDLRLYNLIQGSEVTRKVRFINHAYPAIEDEDGRVRFETSYIEVFVDGILTTDYAVDRMNGQILFNVAPTNGAVITWSGQFFNLMRCNQKSIPTKWKNGYFLVDAGIDLIEPKGAIN